MLCCTGATCSAPRRATGPHPHPHHSPLTLTLTLTLALMLALTLALTLTLTRCAAPRYWPLPRRLAKRWGWPPRLMLVVAAGRRWVDPIGANHAVDRGYATRHVVLDHATRPGLLRGADRARGACPVSLAAPRAAERVPLAGYCRNTDGEGDCSSGDAGAWETRKHKLFSLQACVAKCRGCARCTVVSFSRLQHDCSWYHRCHVGEGSSAAAPHALDAERLINVDSGWDYVTVRARPLPEPARELPLSLPLPHPTPTPYPNPAPNPKPNRTMRR